MARLYICFACTLKTRERKSFSTIRESPGGTAELVHTVLDEELAKICKERLELYKENYVCLPNKLCEKRITPILRSLFPFNPCLSTQGELVRRHAEENGFEFWDMHNVIIAELDGACFEEDGTHYSLKGDGVGARAV